MEGDREGLTLLPRCVRVHARVYARFHARVQACRKCSIDNLQLSSFALVGVIWLDSTVWPKSRAAEARQTVGKVMVTWLLL